jgi:hypothetical protein
MSIYSEIPTVNGKPVNTPVPGKDVIQAPQPLIDPIRPRTPEQNSSKPPVVHSDGWPNILALCGVHGVGKDYVLKKLGYSIYGFADPMYVVAEHFLGTSDKSEPGVRRFLQTMGQWGRGVVSEQYPLTLERAKFTQSLLKGTEPSERQLRDKLVNRGVQMRLWGTPECWSTALVTRLRGALAARPPATRLGISNVRFLNEIEALGPLSPELWFVHAPSDEIKARRGSEVKGASEDVSEVLASAIRKSLKNGAPVEIEGRSICLTELISGVIWNSESEVVGIDPSITVKKL